MSGKKLVLVTGGARSGKSSFGESLLREKQGNILYIATAQAFDEEMKERIKHHKIQRPSHWMTHEGYENLGPVISVLGGQIEGVLLDCVTIMVTNLMFQLESNWDEVGTERIHQVENHIQAEVKTLLDTVKGLEIPVIFITNEIGMGIVPENKLARIFRDIAGRVNQMIAKEADQVYLVTCGISQRIK
ncbi:Adenosylcobinamide-phosphate guanylyltransferase [Alkaliphilus metalliredigens QYMF]|uniref:Adenosylcobinamide kinase n=1 Tax=Alkaliphilus metalliredigens (strain QYMF) TaxID=293826 RepID=A6TU77_ALKMQ|nr:bifunctional adenosylcobinamide kinase/adenosylcobinamide-phosphate guanylyltransferase [Alkaliphilus metalliredigens]ABR49745.1 Adenosylcobinamide-phosphate guanylyltransferase [Alkaliphilus metalliredigens QYMF]